VGRGGGREGREGGGTPSNLMAGRARGWEEMMEGGGGGGGG
jgi:hypothetical protein